MKTTLRKLKSLLRVALGKELLVRPDVSCEQETHGSDYGGWDIVPQGIDTDSIVYSVGVGEDASFDIGLMDKYGLVVHAFDPTPKSVQWVKEQQFPASFVMHEYGLADFDGNVSFNPPENSEHVSHTLLTRPETQTQAISVPVKRLATIMDELGHSQIDILKMDIEGAEYDVIEDIANSKIRPQQILVEFHHRFPGVGVAKTKEAIDRIRAMGYQLFSASKTQEEFSFLRRAA